MMQLDKSVLDKWIQWNRGWIGSRKEQNL